jgi:hypothetical protein
MAVFGLQRRAEWYEFTIVRAIDLIVEAVRTSETLAN